MTNIIDYVDILPQRVYRRITVDDVTGCWMWQGSTYSSGYGRTRWDNPESISKYSEEMLHRLMWKLTFGTIPDTLCVCHRCNTKRCCNPSHLYLATRGDNVRHAARDGLFPDRRGMNASCSKLNEEQVHFIRANYTPRSKILGAIALGKQFGVDRQVIEDVYYRVTYQNIQ